MAILDKKDSTQSNRPSIVPTAEEILTAENENLTNDDAAHTE